MKNLKKVIHAFLMLVVAWLTSCTDAPSEEQVVPSPPTKVALRTPSEAAAIAVDVKQGSATIILQVKLDT